jgi:hypothetical protein
MNGVNGIINVALSDDFTIVDGSGTRYTGVTGFTFELWNPSNTNVAASIVPTVAELGAGSYRVTFTPNALGLWKLVVYHATYFPAGKEGNYQIYSADITAINTTLSTLVADVWGYASRSLTTFGTIVSDISTAVWSATNRTLTAFGFSQTVRDAMKLAPTAGTPADGSIDDHLDDISSWTEFIKDVEGGGWTITGNQMIFYKADNVTELFRVNLFKNGVASSDEPDKRTRV